MKAIAINPRELFWEFDRKKLRSVIRAIILLQAILFAFLYYQLRDPFKWLQPYLPGAVGAPQYLYSIYGPFDDAMQKPMAVTVSGRRIFVSDTGNSRVMVFDYNGDYIHTFGSNGTEPGQFRFPYGIAADSQGRILVADMYNGNISVFSPQGAFLNYFATPADMTSPAGLAIADGRVYVADVARHQILVFDEEGNKLFEFGQEGSETGQFLSPNAVAVHDMYVAVSDTGNHRIQIFNKLGTLVNEIPVIEEGRSFANPRGIAFTTRGELYAVNNMTHQVTSFTQNGDLQHLFGKMGQGPGEAFLPNGLFIDDLGRVYVTDTSNRRVNVYQ